MSEFETRPLDDPEFLKFQKNRCWCHTCRPIDYRDVGSVYMRVCPECGNKRCPKASYHGNACTNSNEPNQTGSIYSTDWENWKANKDIA